MGLARILYSIWVVLSFQTELGFRFSSINIAEFALDSTCSSVPPLGLGLGFFFSLRFGGFFLFVFLASSVCRCVVFFFTLKPISRAKASNKREMTQFALKVGDKEKWRFSVPVNHFYFDHGLEQVATFDFHFST